MRAYKKPGRPPCSIEGCEKPLYAKGVCVTHYSRMKPGRACGFEGCTGTVHSGYYCPTHYSQRKKTGEMRPIKYIRPGGKCGEPDCDRPHKARGLCRRHYEAAQSRGDFPVRLCSVDGCSQRSRKRGMCATHYAQARRRGEIEGPKCSVPGCDVYAARAGRCDRHAKRASMYGLSDEEMGRLEAGVPCEICGGLSDVVDHSHTRGHVRGYLCGMCNTAIGLLRDDPALAISAARYLEKDVARHVA